MHQILLVLLEAVLISQEKSVFITDFRYVEQAAKQCKGYEIVQQKKSMNEEIANQVEKLGIKKLGFEQDLRDICPI